MRTLETLQPSSVFSYFEDLCAIPHGSGNTKAISDYCVAFAKAQGLRWLQDELNNVVIFKPGTAGYEDAPAVMLQGHLDMVAEKDADCPLDMSRDGLSLFIDGDWIGARGTTLGGDDGIAVAMALAVLESRDLPHPPIEAVFTVDEEVGMEGAAGLDAAPLTSRILLNIDSEDEGVFTVSCAGGLRANCSIPYSETACEMPCFALTIEGLKGGHSGVEINQGRGNSNMLMGRVLNLLRAAIPALRLVSVAGGQKDNAIPLSTKAILALPADADAADLVARLQADLSNEYAGSDPGVRVTLTAAQPAAATMDLESTGRVIDFLTLVPDGVHAMSMDIPGLVQTSSNLGVLHTENGMLTACSAIRSSVSSQKHMIYDRICALVSRLGGTVSYTGDYPGWQYRRQSPLRDTAVAVFQAECGYAPKVEAIHAGLECGLLADKLPGLDAISFGPDMRDIHTSRERLSISSTQRTWNFLCALLQALN